MRLHDNFEWDEDKAKKNLKKHRVSFNDAARVLGDEDGDSLHVEAYDAGHSGDEERYVTTASHPDDRRIVLLVSWTDRSSDNERLTRIISARAATAGERGGMPGKSGVGRNVRKSVGDVPAASTADLDRLRAAMEGPVDTSEIPRRPATSSRLIRDASGRLPARRSPIREAIVCELKRRKMTPYRLWKDAKEHCPTLSQSAVHEFLKGQRQLELPYAEALMTAVHLGIVRRKVAKKAKADVRGKQATGRGDG